MYEFEEYPGTDRSDAYRLNEQVRQSYDALRDALSAPPPIATPSALSSPGLKDRLTASVHPRKLTWKDGQSRLVSPQEAEVPSTSAAETLRKLLERSYGSEHLAAGEPVPTEHPKRETPSTEEVSTLLQQHTALTQQLEAENRYVKEELAVLRLKLSEVIDENKHLHSELKTTVVHEILRDGSDLVQFMGSTDDGLAEMLTFASGGHEFKRWHIELERLSRLHAAKCERLETQLKHAKSEVNRLEQIVEDLKSQLRMQDSVPTHDLGFIAGDAAFTATSRATFQTTIDRLTKDRDETCERVSALTTQNLALSQREEELYQQIKKSIALVEQAQLEMTEAMVQKEQLSEELQRMRERFELHVRDSQATMLQEREAARRENHFLIEDLSKQLLEQQGKFTIITEKLEKEMREKAELSAQNLELKGHLRSCDREVTIAAENYRAHSTNATLQRSAASQEVERLRGDYQQLQRERDQEKKILHNEVGELKRRLHKAEQGLLNAKEECLHLTNDTSALERELHLAKLTREGIERGRSEDLKLVTLQASEREEKLRTAMEDADNKYSHQVHEMDSMLHRQNKLILRLREECRRQAGELERITKKYRAQNTRLKNEADSMAQRLEKTLARLSMLEDQTEQHGQVHSKMAARLKAMDDHAQNQATQLVEILAVNSRMSRDRQLLAKEVEFLRTQLTRLNVGNMNSSEEGVLRLHSSSKPLVDDILNALTKEERSGGYQLAATNERLKRSELLKTAAELEDETEAQDIKDLADNM